jgi:hypothetical protein
MTDSHTLTPSPTALAAAMDVRVGGWPLARSLRPQSRGISQ